MLIGVPKEVKSHEYRVGLVPGSVRELVHHGHKVVVETGAGVGIGFDDRIYETAGAEILMRGADVFAAAELIVKVKEPQPDEVQALREDQILFTYLHLAADRALTEALRVAVCRVVEPEAWLTGVVLSQLVKVMARQSYWLTRRTMGRGRFPSRRRTLPGVRRSLPSVETTSRRAISSWMSRSRADRRRSARRPMSERAS